MYESVSSVPLQSSASALGNNLSVWCDEEAGRLHFGVVHRNCVNIVAVRASQSNSSNVHDNTLMAKEVTYKDVTTAPGGLSNANKNQIVMILQAKWVVLEHDVLFVVASERGIQIFDSDGSALLHWHAFNTDPETLETTFARGIAGYGNLLCIGAHDGHILVFEVPKDSSMDIILSEKAKGHAAAITDLRNSKSLLASADESGGICLWEAGPGLSLSKFRTLESYGSICTGVVIWEDLVLAGYGTGHLRVFSVISGQIVAEVTAHARWISAIDVALETGLVLSASEDSFVRVWQLSTSDSVISHKFSHCIQDCQLHGACFLNESGSSFGITGYDMNEIMRFRM